MVDVCMGCPLHASMASSFLHYFCYAPSVFCNIQLLLGIILYFLKMYVNRRYISNSYDTTVQI